jgi:type VI secretion system secreted protein VgrG
LQADGSRKQKEDYDKAQAQSKREDDRAKQKELDDLDKKWAEAHSSDAARMADLKKRTPLSDSEQAELNKLTDQREKDLYAKKTEVTQRYDARNTARNAPSAPDNQGFMGWPGIIGKFGTDALMNVAGMAYLQSRANGIAQKIKALKPASEIALGEQGIVQRVLDTSVDPPTEAGRIELRPTTGVKIDAKRFEVDSKGIADIKAASTMNLSAPDIVLSSDGSKTNAHVWVLGTAKAGIKTPSSSLTLDAGDADLTGDKIVVGRKIPTPDPVPGILKTQLDVAEVAVAETTEAHNTAWDQYLRADTDVTKAVAWLACEAANKARVAAIEARDAIEAKLAARLAPANDNLLAGLTVDNAKTALTHTATAVEVTAQGVAMSFGAAKFELNAQGLSGSGPLIKLG